MDNTDINDGLTEAERAALELDDEPEGEGDADKENGADSAGGDVADDAAAANADAQTAATEQDGAAEPVAAEPVSEQSSGPQAESAPILVVQPPADADAKLAEIAGKKGELQDKFDDGDLTAKEYQQQLDALYKQERDIEFDVRESKLAEKLEAQRQANDWKATVDSFIRQNDIYDPKNSPAMYQLLDIEVRRVALTDEFKSRTDSAAGHEILKKAHDNLATQLKFQKAEAKPEKQPIKKPDLPPNLAKVPASEQSDTNGGKFAVLERMSAYQLEEAVASGKVSQRDFEAYMAAS